MNISRHIQILSLAFIPACLISTAQSAAVKYFEFPRPTGQYAVGTKVIELTDMSRIDPETTQPRKLVMQAWYPAEGKLDKPTSAYAYEMLKVSKKQMAEEYAAQAELTDQLDLIRTYATYDASAKSVGQPYPVVAFAHGYGTPRGYYTSFCEDIASHGYVVLMVMHTYVTDITHFNDGSEVGLTRELNLDLCRTCVSDIEFMLDNAQSGAFKDLTHICDFKNSGIVGHSLGGTMANLICRDDSRFTSGISLDGLFREPRAKEPLHKPFMFMLAENSLNEMREDDEYFREYLKSVDMTAEEFPTCFDAFCQKNGADSYKIILKDAEHCTFSDCSIVVNVLKEIFKTDDIHLGAGTIDGLIAIEVIRSHIINFFDKYLKGQPSAILDGSDTRYAEHVEFKSWM